MRAGRVLRLVGLLVGLVVVMAVTMAPASDKPEQLTMNPPCFDGNPPCWDSANEWFNLQFEVQRSALDPGEICPNCEIRAAAVKTRVEVFELDGTPVAVLLPPLHLVVARPGALQTHDRMVAIRPQHVPWLDRDASGLVIVRVQASLVWLDDHERSPHVETSVEATLTIE